MNTIGKKLRRVKLVARARTPKGGLRTKSDIIEFLGYEEANSIKTALAMELRFLHWNYLHFVARELGVIGSTPRKQPNTRVTCRKSMSRLITDIITKASGIKYNKSGKEKWTWVSVEFIPSWSTWPQRITARQLPEIFPAVAENCDIIEIVNFIKKKMKINSQRKHIYGNLDHSRLTADNNW